MRSINTKAIRWYDYFTLSIHILVLSVFTYELYFNSFGFEVISPFLLIYLIVHPVFMLMFYHVLFRERKKFIFWFIVASIQLIVYFYFEYRFHELGINPFFPLRALFVMMLTYQILRQIFILIKQREMIYTYRKFSWYDHEEKKRISWLDILFSIILFVVTVIVAMADLLFADKG